MKKVLTSKYFTIVTYALVLMLFLAMLYDLILVTNRVSCEVYRNSFNLVMQSLTALIFIAASCFAALHLISCLINKHWKKLLVLLLLVAVNGVIVFLEIFHHMFGFC